MNRRELFIGAAAVMASAALALVTPATAIDSYVPIYDEYRDVWLLPDGSWVPSRKLFEHDNPMAADAAKRFMSRVLVKDIERAFTKWEPKRSLLSVGWL
jgi:hypothetical protein